ncbi:MAG: DUF3575 domain-containing protein [Gammaproteobacteria bacterium]|nr:DUF3575 domain-containing protein [Gammaproteobacteria bacterium]MDH5653538.1 DUF3575 domain-containing protein [Gammaproteobacteria bacterium]
MQNNILTYCLTSLFLFGLSCSAQAAENPNPSISVNLYDKTDSSAVVYRKMMTDDVAVGAGLALRRHKSEQTGQEFDAMEIIGSGRYYLVKGGLRHFLEGEMRYVYVNYDGSAAEYKGHGAVLGAYYGVEYFVSKTFSLDGRAGAEYIYLDYDQDGSKDRGDAPNVRLGLNYYWD